MAYFPAPPERTYHKLLDCTFSVTVQEGHAVADE
jgi:hypothetical protein